MKLNTEATAFCVTDEIAVTESRNQLTVGQVDQGPVQATTTAMSTMLGQPDKERFAERRAELAAPRSGLCAIAAPPKPRIVFGRQIFTKKNRTQKETRAPLKSAGRAPRSVRRATALRCRKPTDDCQRPCFDIPSQPVTR